MNTYLIQRTVPGAGRLSADELRALTEKSNEVLAAMAPGPQWLHSYVAEDQLICVYRAEHPDAISEHARRGGFPIDAVHLVHDVIDPTRGG